MSENISRKRFIKNLGLASLSVPGIAAIAPERRLSETIENPSGETNIHSNSGKEWITRRGSWVRKGDALAGDITLAGSKRGCRIMLAQKEHSAVGQAAIFLSKDIARISGFTPEISHKPGAEKAVIRIVTLPDAALPKEIDITAIAGKWEAHKIVTYKGDLWVIGADFRGTAFAIYTLSERLGIDPLYLWTGYTPVKYENLILKKTDYISASPSFKYRGFFHDDEDILPRPFEMSGYPLRIGDVDMIWYERYFETALRLKMNMVAPYTRVHRRYQVQKRADEWGLIYTSHHYDILLSNPFGIERFNLAEKRGVNPDWNWVRNKEGMVKYWRGGVEENKALDCIWPVGLRGTNDYPYQFPKGTSEKEETRVFNQVIETQVKTVKDILPATKPVYTFTLWDEMVRKYESDKENFVLPEDVMIIWSDNMDGEMPHLPDTPGKWKHGIYYHLAMYGGGVTKQAVNTVSAFKIHEAFGRILDAGATEYMLVNVSELREYIMGAQQIADICWDAQAMVGKKTKSDVPGTGEAYLEWWCNEYFGADAVPHAVSVFKQYYEIFEHPTLLWYAADVVRYQLEELVKKMNGQPFKVTHEKDVYLLDRRNSAYEKVMKDYNKAIATMSPAQQQFFFENTKLGLSFDWRPTQTALLLHKALLAKDEDEAWRFIHQAIRPLEQLELDILKAERPPFDKWYRETWIRGTLTPLNVHRSYLLMRAFISSEGKASKPPKRNGHDNIPQSKAWSRFLEESEKINDPLSLS